MKPALLRSGFTTGACAAAAAKGAALMMMKQKSVATVTIDLPAGISATFPLCGQSFSPEHASCCVVKDAGDDPDVTNGAEVWATLSRSPDHPADQQKLFITGGTGIGRVTKPGLAVAPGEWAINPVPRQMIREAVESVLSAHFRGTCPLHVTISIPDGAERAKKTLNERLGIIGGLSILGTTGIVRPVSAQAWTDTIDAALDVAKACGCPTVVLSTGRTSEMAAQRFFGELKTQEEAFIMMGDHVAHSLNACATRSYYKPLISCQFAKLLKIACGHENTHAAVSDVEISKLCEWCERDGLGRDIIVMISKANTARELIISLEYAPELIATVFRQASDALKRHHCGIAPRFLLCGYSGETFFS